MRLGWVYLFAASALVISSVNVDCSKDNRDYKKVESVQRKVWSTNPDGNVGDVDELVTERSTVQELRRSSSRRRRPVKRKSAVRRGEEDVLAAEASRQSGKPTRRVKGGGQKSTKVADVVEADASNQDAQYEDHDEAEGRGYEASSGYKKGSQGSEGDEKTRGSYDVSGGDVESYGDEDNYQEGHHEHGGGEKGSSHGEAGKGAKKGFKKGYRDTYHKDEHSKDGSYYDNHDEGGFTVRFGNVDKFEKSKAGKKYDGEEKASGKEEDEYGDQGKFVKGSDYEEDRGQDKEYGKTSYYGKDEKYGRRRGNHDRHGKVSYGGGGGHGGRRHWG